MLPVQGTPVVVICMSVESPWISPGTLKGTALCRARHGDAGCKPAPKLAVEIVAPASDLATADVGWPPSLVPSLPLFERQNQIPDGFSRPQSCVFSVSVGDV